MPILEPSGKGFASTPKLPAGCIGYAGGRFSLHLTPLQPLLSLTALAVLVFLLPSREAPSIAFGAEDPRLFLMDDGELGMVRIASMLLTLEHDCKSNHTAA